MAKAGNVSDRKAYEQNKAMTERPCLAGCGAKMRVAVEARKWRSVWACDSCGATRPKTKGDWTP